MERLSASPRFRIIAFVVQLGAGCTKESQPAAEPSSEGTVAAANDGAPIAGRPRDSVAAARQLRWTLPDVERRLRAVGLDPVAIGQVRQPFMGQPGITYRVKGGEIQAYVYGDAGALARDVDRLDTIRVSPPTMMIEWRTPPILIISNNPAIIGLTRDSTLRKKVREAITVNRAVTDTN